MGPFYMRVWYKGNQKHDLEIRIPQTRFSESPFAEFDTILQEWMHSWEVSFVSYAVLFEEPGLLRDYRSGSYEERSAVQLEQSTCEACGCSFPLVDGYYSSGEYSYCKNCCHW